MSYSAQMVIFFIFISIVLLYRDKGIKKNYKYKEENLLFSFIHILHTKNINEI